LKLHHHHLTNEEPHLAKLFSKHKSAGGSELEQVIAVGKELQEKLKELDDRVELVYNDKPRFYKELKALIPTLKDGKQFLLHSRQRLLKKLNELETLKSKQDAEAKPQQQQEPKKDEPKVNEWDMTPEQKFSQAITNAVKSLQDPSVSDPKMSQASLVLGNELLAKFNELKISYPNSRNTETYYDILNIKPSASEDEIKKAYRTLAIKYHPDKNDKNDKRFKITHVAYETLSDPIRRRSYDWNKTGGKGMLDHHGDSVNTLYEAVARIGNKNFQFEQTERELQAKITELSHSRHFW